MIKNSLIISLISFSSFLLYLLYKEPSQTEKEKTSIALANYNSTIALYALDLNKTDIAKTMLANNAIFLVQNYDPSLFSKSPVLSSICEDWKIHLKKAVIKELSSYEKVDHNSSNSEVYRKIRSNMKLLDECKTKN